MAMNHRSHRHDTIFSIMTMDLIAILATWTIVMRTLPITFSPADLVGIPIQTMQRLYQILPRVGNGGIVVILQKPRAGGATYLDQTGNPDNIDNTGIKGYRTFLWRGSTDLSNDLSDQITCGFMTAVAGPNGDTSFTVAAGATTTVFSVSAGSIGAEPAALQYRVRFTATTTTHALQNVCRLITAHTTTQITVVNSLGATPAAGDTFHNRKTRRTRWQHNTRLTWPRVCFAKYFGQHTTCQR